VNLTHQAHTATQAVLPDGSTQLVIAETTSGTVRATLDPNACRNWLVGDLEARMTLNAVVRIAHFVSSQVAGVAYRTPTDLSGTAADYPNIIPDEVVAGIALLQAAHDPTDIDGLPGSGFVRDIMGQLATVPATQRLLQFMDERANTATSDADGPLTAPNLDQATEAELYAYLRRLTLVRNGLWSDKPLITNLIALARRPQAADRQLLWNDQFFVCWLEPDGVGGLRPRVLRAVGTTEPGNTNDDPTIPPQTYLVRLGYHKTRQPGGRGHRIVANNSTNRNRRFDLSDARGLNFHSGGDSANDAGFVQKKFPQNSIGETAFKTNLVITELFKHLSHWGNEQANSSLEALRMAAQRTLPAIESATDTKIVIRQQVGRSVQRKERSVAACRAWMIDTWITKRRQPDTLYRILRYVDAGFVAPATPAEVVVTAAHVAEVARVQAAYLGDIGQVDGLPGNTFLEIMAGRVNQAAAARPTYERVLELLANPLLSPTQRRYIRGLHFDTLAERTVLTANRLARPLVGGSFQINESIGTWSIGCQVIYGNEQFYRFWYQLVLFAEQTGQRQWYYTLVEV
jgi:hypothetical protein